jgi:hypothetical protein
MKKILLFGLLAASFSSTAQEDASRFGFFGGLNSYYSKANFLSSKSGIGFTVGILNAILVDDNSEILIEGSFSRNNVDFRGREDAAASPVWVGFTLDRFNLNLIYDYELFHFSNDDMAIGICGGASGSLFQNFELKDPAQEMYLLEPYGVTGYDLEIDTRGSGLTITAYAALGVSLRFKQFEGSLRYYKGLNNAYRNFPAENYAPGREFKGNDNYMAFTVTYFLDDL